MAMNQHEQRGGDTAEHRSENGGALTVDDLGTQGGD